MNLGPETGRSHEKRNEPGGFYDRYCSGIGLDIGYKGSADAQPLPDCIGVDIGFPNYLGSNLPFPQNAVDFVFSSHCLEHVADPLTCIYEWWRVAREYVIIMVPHQYLYEKRKELPSRWNRDHKRFYTPSKLLAEIETALEPNSYRVVHLRDNDDWYNYSIDPSKHSDGCYEIECVIKKIKKPEWDLA